MYLLSQISIPADGEQLCCEYSLAAENVVILHGAGQSNRRRYYSLAEEILRQGKGVILFDFSGHGDSTGTLAELSLQRRMTQARTVIDTLLPTGAFYLAGFSMSGQTVCDLLPVYGDRVKGILLACAAAYRPDIYDIPFGNSEFTTKLREGGWQDSVSRDNLLAYKGRVVLAMGEQDEVIPKGVTELLKTSALSPQYIEYPGVAHGLMTWLGDHPEEQAKLVQALID